ncbi:MAG: hypothetical protein J5J00_06325 [Deltaproteobacteria bacterium]|nr:hypothetical protein [Deltaproteobacteria bacterium]
MAYSALFSNLLPLYAIIVCGFAAGRWLKIDRNTVANLLIYVLVPIAIFGFIAQLRLYPAVFLAPLIAFAVSSFSAFVSFRMAQRSMGVPQASLAGFCAAGANAGYFGIPLFLMSHAPEELGAYMITIIGYLFYESGPGYFILARGNYSARESLVRLLRLPTIHAAVLGVAVSMMEVQLPVVIIEYLQHIKGAYIVLGMMLVGIALSEIRNLKINMRLTAQVMAFKFLFTPLFMTVVVLADYYSFRLLDRLLISCLITISIVPVAANTTAFASILNLPVAEAGVLVVVSTLAALPMILIVYPWLLGLL